MQNSPIITISLLLALLMGVPIAFTSLLMWFATRTRRPAFLTANSLPARNKTKKQKIVPVL